MLRPMSRKTYLGGAAAILLALLAGYFLWPRSSAGTGQPTADQALSADEILALRKAARQAGDVDLSPGALGGRVVDEQGGGIAGAVVSVGRKDFSLGARTRPGQAAEPMVAVSGADGRFVIRELPPGTYTLAATARGHAPAALEGIAVAAGEERDDLVITMSRGGHLLSGLVADIGGGPIGGALVRATSLSGADSVLDFFRAPYSARTGDDGRYELPLGDGVYALQVVHTDYVSTERTTEIRGADRTEDFTLTPGAVIYGQVLRRADDEPMAGATVAIAPGLGRGGQNMMSLGVGIGGTTMTDAEGRFELRGLASGSVGLRAFGRGFATREPTEVELGIGEQVDGVVIYVDPAYTISGFVVDKDDRATGLEGVLLGAFNFGGAFHLAGDPSASDGYFEIHGVGNGSYIVGAAGEGRILQIDGDNVTVDNADVDDVVIELDNGVEVSGVLSPPKAGQVLVEIDPESISFGNAFQVAGLAFVRGRAGADGTFTIDAVPQGTITLVAKAEDGSEGRTEITVADTDLTGVVIPLDARASVAGTVTDERGQPVPGVRVRASALDPGKDRGFSLDFNMIAGSGDASGLTRPDGSFHIAGVEAGRHGLSVRDERGQLSWARSSGKGDPVSLHEVTVEGTTPVTGVSLVVEARDGEIAGTVVGPDGEPVGDAWVTARHSSVPDWNRTFDEDEVEEMDRGGGTDWEGTPEKPVLTDGAGRFAITGLRDGIYNLEAEGLRGTARGEKDKVALGADVRIELEPLAGITGVVMHPQGEPVQSYILEVGGAGGRRVQVANPDGRYKVSRLEPGDYQLQVIAEEGRAGGKVEVEANEIAELDLEIVAYGSVRGRLVNAASGEPMPDLVVMASTEEGTDWAELAMTLVSGEGLRTDDDGRFVVGRLGAGAGQLAVVDGEIGGFQLVAQTRFTLEPGQDLDLGEIRGVPVNQVPKDQRGELGMSLSTAKWPDRPLPEGGEPGEPPAGLDGDTEYLWVAFVDEGGAAAEAGVQVGDRITAIDGNPVELIGLPVARQLLSSRSLRAGTPIQLGIDRDGSATTLAPVPRPAPEE